MMKKLVAYGVNLGKKDGNDIVFERYITTASLAHAKEVYQALKEPNELRLWAAVEIEEIYECANGEWDYNVIYSAEIHYEDFWMENRSYWTHQQALHKEIYDVTIAEDRETDGRPINICWLKLGYISPSSGCGFFHYSSLKEFELYINNVVHISNKFVTKKEVQDYLWWLESNECMFKKDKSQITQIAEMLTGEPK